MGKHSDKLLFLLAIALCGAGFGSAYWLQKEAKKEASAAPKTAKKPADADTKGYERVALPDTSEFTDEKWEEPKHPETDGDDFLWRHELFTPVKILWAKTDSGRYQPEGIKPIPEPAFGVKLLSIAHPIYRLKLRGTSDRSIYLADAASATPSRQHEIYNLQILRNKIWSTQILRRHREQNSLLSDDDYRDKLRTDNARLTSLLDADVKAKANEQKKILDQLGVEILQIHLPTREDFAARKNTTAFVKFRDTRLNREFTLFDEKDRDTHTFPEISIFELAKPDGSAVWTWTKIGDTHELDAVGKFTLEAADFAAKTVTVKKNYEVRNIYGRTVAKSKTEILAAEKTEQPPPIATEDQIRAIPTPQSTAPKTAPAAPAATPKAAPAAAPRTAPAAPAAAPRTSSNGLPHGATPAAATTAATAATQSSRSGGVYAASPLFLPKLQTFYFHS